MKDESWLEASILEISKAHLFNVEGGSEPYWGIWNVIISVTFLIEYIFSASVLFSLSMRLMSYPDAQRLYPSPSVFCVFF